TKASIYVLDHGDRLLRDRGDPFLRWIFFQGRNSLGNLSFRERIEDSLRDWRAHFVSDGALHLASHHACVLRAAPPPQASARSAAEHGVPDGSSRARQHRRGVVRSAGAFPVFRQSVLVL